MISAGRRSRGRPTRIIRALVLAGLTAGGVSSWSARPAWAASAVPPNSVSLIAGPGAALTTPADGRIRGDHLAAVVTGVALAAKVGSGSSVQTAAPGQRLVVFGLQGAHLGQSTDDHGKPIPPVTGTLIVDGQRRALPAPRADDGTAPVYYRASVPAQSHDVGVELAASGLAQTFSLTAGARVGAQPAVLYRDQATWKPLDQVNADAVLPTPDPADRLPGATLPIHLHDVYLAWFGPGGPADVPASPDQAWLVVDATSQDDSQIGSRYLHYLTGLAAGQVTLALPGGPAISSRLLDPGTGEKGVGVFDGTYDFAVPAALTTATLTIGPATFQATVAYSGSTPVNVTTQGQAAFPLSFPAPYQPPPPVAPAQPDSHAVASPAATAPSGGGTNAAIPLAAGAAVVLAAAGAALLARRQRRAALPEVAPVAPGRGEGLTAGTSSAPPRPPPPPAPSPVRPPAVYVDEDEAPDAPAPARASTPAPAMAPPPATPPPPAPVLAAIPAGPPRPPDRMLYFEVLGPLRVTGWPDDRSRSAPVLDLATFLALHPGRPYTTEELRDPLSIGKPRALEADTVRTYASTLRRNVGVEHVPGRGRQGYGLAQATTDWHRFLELAAEADHADGPAAEARSLADALALVRGLPFSELPPSSFGWVATELLVSRIEVAVIAAAGRLVELALDAGDWRLAAWGCQQGLLVSPTAHDLNVSAVRAAERSGQPDRLAQAWRDVTRRYAAADEAVPVELQELRTALRQPGASVPSSSRSATAN